MKLTVDWTTRGRVWLEAHSIPLPDPWAPEDIPKLIEQHYPGGRAQFMADKSERPPPTTRPIRTHRQRRLARLAAARRKRDPSKARAASKRYYEKHKHAILWRKSAKPSERKRNEL